MKFVFLSKHNIETNYKSFCYNLINRIFKQHVTFNFIDYPTKITYITI